MHNILHKYFACNHLLGAKNISTLPITRVIISKALSQSNTYSTTGPFLAWVAL